LTGVILCGGASSRMGTDKGLMGDSEPWALSAYEKLQTLSISVYVAINHTQTKTYGAFFDENRLIIDDINIPIKGPMLGILSCFDVLKDDLLVLACDMPYMTTTLLETLQNTSAQNTDYEAFIFKKEENPEPLCAIYTSKGLSKIKDWITQNKIEKCSMKYFLSLLHTKQLPIIAQDFPFFENINYKG
jgi:molybdenum cofactor guanylyltransferase